MIKKAKVQTLFVILLSILLLISGCGSSKPAAAPAPASGNAQEIKWETVRLLYTESVYSLTSLVAQEKGFFTEEHLNVNMQPLANGGLATSALVGKSADFAVGSSGRFLNAVNKNLPIKAIAITHWGFAGEVIVKKGDDTSKKMEDLKGKKLAVQMGSGSSGVWLRYIDKLGLTPKDFKIYEMDTETIPAAFEKGEIDAAVPWVPFSTLVEDKGLGKVIIDADTIAKEVNAYYAFPVLTRQELIDKKPEVVQRFANAWVKAHVWIQKNPDEAREILVKAWENLGLKLDEKIAKTAMKYVHTDRSGFTDADVEDMVQTALAYKKFGVSNDAADAAKIKNYIDNSFVQKAEAKLRK
ncbi:MAG: ABC transporter substrate-binding protein [Desulfitobacterium hafniense]|nr:ABC transporter substrate-binding protein [Desulfitobacterium hafniense]